MLTRVKRSLAAAGAAAVVALAVASPAAAYPSTYTHVYYTETCGATWVTHYNDNGTVSGHDMYLWCGNWYVQIS